MKVPSNTFLKLMSMELRYVGYTEFGIGGGKKALNKSTYNEISLLIITLYVLFTNSYSLQ